MAPVWTENSSWWNGTYLDFDSSNDTADGADWGDYGTTHFDDETCIIMEVGNIKEVERLMYFSMNGGNWIRVGTSSFITNNQNGPNGEIGLRYRDGNVDDIIFSTDNVLYDDTGSSRQFLAFQFENLNPSTGQIYINDGFVSTSNKKIRVRKVKT